MDELTPILERLDRIEARLAALEASTPQASVGTSSTTSSSAALVDNEIAAPPTSDAISAKPHTTSASNWMAWGASSAFVLAAIYFVKLIHDSGWLTPERQIAIAVLGAVGLIWAGVRLSSHNREYAAYLPAAGIVVLYLSVYAAHAYYQLIGSAVVMCGIGITTLVSIWLHRTFNHTMYALFAVIGAYSFPLFVRSQSPDVTDMVIYFTAWSLLFSFIALQEGRRTIYILALYFAVIGFDIAWRESASSDAWLAAAIYQFCQFLIFSATAVFFSVRYKSPLEKADAIVHGGALFYFYVIEFMLLKQHVPSWAPIIALLSALFVLALFLIARRFFQQEAPLRAGGVLVSTYCCAVTTHIMFFELLPHEYIPWAALLGPVAVSLLRPKLEDRPEAVTPIMLAAGFVFVIGLCILLFADPVSSDIPVPYVALFLYSAVLYAATWSLHQQGEENTTDARLLFAGHIAFMVATLKTFESGFVISSIWGLFAIVLLIIAVQYKNKILGQSSLIIFAASGLKVLLYDLTGSPSLIRVITLVVVGASLYAGGWLYQQIAKEPEHVLEKNVGEH
jgi:uncharacterized membrane protein